MSRRVTRRGVLLGGGGAAGLLALGGFVSVPDEVSVVRSMLHRLLPDLRIEPEQETAFAEAFLVSHRRSGRGGGENSLRLVRGLEVMPAALQTQLPQRLRWAQASFEDKLLRMFLLSTDYLEARETPERSVVFTIIADPYIALCANPWAQLETT